MPTHQLILDGLASNLADCILAGDTDLEDEKRKDVEILTNAASVGSTSKSNKVGSANFLSINAAHSLISLSRFLSSISTAVSPTTERGRANNDEHLVPVLDDVIKATKGLTATDVEALVGSANEWPLADRLAGALVESLLKTAINAPQHRQTCFEAIVVLAEK